MATNGPYHWGNGPRPHGKVRRAKGKAKESGCAMTALRLATRAALAVGGAVGSLAAALVRPFA